MNAEFVIGDFENEESGTASVHLVRNFLSSDELRSRLSSSGIGTDEGSSIE